MRCSISNGSRRRSQGTHVDENWYEHGDLPYDLYADTELAHACVAGASTPWCHARGVNYDAFPIDTRNHRGQPTARYRRRRSTAPSSRPTTCTTTATTEKLAALAVACADEQGKRVAVVGVGGPSGPQFRTEIDVRAATHRQPRRRQVEPRIPQLIESGDVAQLRAVVPEFARHARADMGFMGF